jgi:hypothetical protein
MNDRPPTEGESLIMMIGIMLIATLLINGIVYMFIGG